MAMLSAEPRPGKDMATRFGSASSKFQVSYFKDLPPLYTKGGKSFVSEKQKSAIFGNFFTTKMSDLNNKGSLNHLTCERGLAESAHKLSNLWHDLSLSLPANGLTFHSLNSSRSSRKWAMTAWSLPVGATTLNRIALSPSLITSRRNGHC
jgi:hypothetical protein